jgi:hypothetical protein
LDRASSSAIRLLSRLAVVVAVGVLVLLPALHAPHLDGYADPDPVASFAVASNAGATSCPLCIFVGQQARCAAASCAVAFAPALSPAIGSARITPERRVAAIHRAATAPRAPPA